MSDFVYKPCIECLNRFGHDYRKECDNYCQFAMTLKSANNAPAVNAIIIPDNATNGDVIRALFPNDDINPSTITSIIHKIPFGRNEYCSDWWNAPYKGR